MALPNLQRYIPSPLAIALGLTVFTFALVALISPPSTGLPGLAGFWYQGVWELLAFAMQMVLILVLGHTLALSPAIEKLIDKIAQQARSPASAVGLTAGFTMLAGMLNWGLGLVFGAILARSMAYRCTQRGVKVNYPLLATAGYTGMMVWHGGLSGSAPLKVADADHFLVDAIGIIGVNQTLFTTSNLLISGLVIVGTLLILMQLARKSKRTLDLPSEAATKAPESTSYLSLSRLIGLLILTYGIYRLFLPDSSAWSIIDLNYINFLLLGTALSFHPSLASFSAALQQAVGGASGIIIQFPLYAGIMGLMKYSGALSSLSASLIATASAGSLPYLTFISAGLLNLLVPSGGGQWAVQGPVVTEAALQLGVAPEHIIMALAYGDGLTNMLQPFWALPLLGITRLEARDIAPYCLRVFLIGLVLYSLGIWLWL